MTHCLADSRSAITDRPQLIAIADYSLRHARGLETNSAHKACTIQNMTVNHEDDDLTRMTVFTVLLQCIRDHCKTSEVEHLATPLPPGTWWFAKFLGPAGFQLCTCWYPYQLSNSTQLCLCIPGLRRNRDGPTGEELTQAVAFSPQRALTRYPTDRITGSSRGELTRREVLVTTCNNDPWQPRERSTGIDARSQERHQTAHWDQDQDRASAFLENLKAELPPPPPPRPSSLEEPPRGLSIQGNLGKKEYCMHWIKTGECSYLQQGCKYKHKIPTDPEIQQRIGLRKMPDWISESHHPEDFMERPEAHRSNARDLESRMGRQSQGSHHDSHPRKRRFLD